MFKRGILPLLDQILPLFGCFVSKQETAQIKLNLRFHRNKSTRTQVL